MSKNITPIEAKVLTVTPECAYEMLLNTPYEHQRSVKQWRLKQYTQDMRNGKWEPGSEIKIGVVDGKKYLINGQHRLQAVFDSGTAQVFVASFVTFPDMDALGRAYYRIDTGAGRSLKDAYTATDLAERLSLGHKQLEMLGGAVRMIQSGFANSVPPFSRDDTMQSIEEWASAMRLVVSAVSQGQRSIQDKSYNAPTLAVALYTMRYQEEKALSFWRTVSNNDGLRKGQPEHTLVNFLLTAVVNKEGRNFYARRIASCWNAFYTNKEILWTQIRDPKSTIVIEGTPLYHK